MSINTSIATKDSQDSGFQSLQSMNNNSTSYTKNNNKNNKPMGDMIYDTPYTPPQQCQRIQNGIIVVRQSTMIEIPKSYTNKETSYVSAEIDIESENCRSSTLTSSDVDKTENNITRDIEVRDCKTDNTIDDDKADETIENDCYATVLPKAKRLAEKSEPVQPTVPERNYTLDADKKEPIIEPVTKEVEEQPASVVVNEPQEVVPSGGYGEYETFASLQVNNPKSIEENSNSSSKETKKMISDEEPKLKPPGLPNNSNSKKKYKPNPPKEPAPPPPTDAIINTKTSSTENLSDTLKSNKGKKLKISSSLQDISPKRKREEDIKPSTGSKQKTSNKFLLFFKRMKIHRKSAH